MGYKKNYKGYPVEDIVKGSLISMAKMAGWGAMFTTKQIGKLVEHFFLFAIDKETADSRNAQHHKKEIETFVKNFKK